MNTSEAGDPLLQEFEDAYVKRHIPVIIYEIVVNLCGIVGNIATMIYYGKKARARNAAVNPLFITAISINDLITSLLLCALGPKVDLTPMGFFQDAFICQGNVFLLKSFATNSFIVLILIGFDRYFLVCCRPFSKLNFTLKRAMRFVIAGTVFSVIFASREFVTYDVVKRNITIGENRTITVTTCVPFDVIETPEFFLASYILDMILLVAALGMLIVLYTLIMWKILKQRRLTRRKSLKAGQQSGGEENKSTNVSSAVDDTLQTNIKLDSGRESEKDKDVRMDGLTNRDIMPAVGEVMDSDRISNENPEMPIDKSTNRNNMAANREVIDSDRKSNENIEMSTEETIEPEKMPAMREIVESPANITTHSTTNQPKSNKKIESRRRDSTLRITWMMTLMTVASLLSFAPYFVVALVYPHDKVKSAGLMILYRSFMLNSSINPYIIGFMDRNFRQFIEKGLSNYWQFLRRGLSNCWQSLQ